MNNNHPENGRNNFRQKNNKWSKGKQNAQSRPNQSNQNQNGSNGSAPFRKSTRGAAIRAQRRVSDDASRILQQVVSPIQSENIDTRPRANKTDDTPRLKVIMLGGNDGGGSKNMMLVEYIHDAVIVDCGNDLGVDLPGINYAICDTSYLETIRHKLKAYIITHGHLDHIGGLPHIVPLFPAPIYGSRFSVGRVQEIFENFGAPLPEGFELQTVIMNESTHEKLKIGDFFVELVRVTHSIPGSTIVVLDTPVGKIVNTGDFRLDPNPLDHEKTDVERLNEIGNEGVLALFSESTTTERPGRTPSESTIEQSFIDIMDRAPGRIFVGLFSTNMNRVQMIVNAAVHHGKKVAMDGRSMVSTLEMAVRNGFMKIPKGTFIPIASSASIPDDQLVVVCTGSQGEPSSAMVRMSNGEHRNIKLKEQDTVVLSSTPIPYSGNDAKIRAMVDDLKRKGVHVYRHEYREIDGCGPLHVSGHASIDEYRDMIKMIRPKFFVPIYGDYTSKLQHITIAIEEGIPRAQTRNVENGEVVALTRDAIDVEGQVPVGTVLVDQTGSIVSSVVIKDRLILAEEGLVAIVLTIDKKTGMLLTSPDIISRGFIYMRGSEQLMDGLRSELRRAVAQRYKRVDLDRFKQELKEHITHYLFEQTNRSPIVIPVVNVVGTKSEGKKQPNAPAGKQKSPEDIAAEQQKRFAEMRAALLNQDGRTD